MAVPSRLSVCNLSSPVRVEHKQNRMKEKKIMYGFHIQKKLFSLHQYNIPGKLFLTQPVTTQCIFPDVVLHVTLPYITPKRGGIGISGCGGVHTQVYLCKRYTWFLCEHALDFYTELNVDEKQALKEQFGDNYRQWRMLIRLLVIVFVPARLVTVLYNMSLLATWKRRKELN